MARIEKVSFDKSLFIVFLITKRHVNTCDIRFHFLWNCFKLRCMLVILALNGVIKQMLSCLRVFTVSSGLAEDSKSTFS